MRNTNTDGGMNEPEVDWSPEERAGLDALPRERLPAPELEARTVRALQARGALGSRQRGARPGAAWWMVVAAAAAALFLGGVQVGQLQGARQTLDTVAAVRGSSALDAAAEVQRTAGAYLSALAVLAERMDAADSSAVLQAREVVESALAASAAEALRVNPDDGLAAAIRAVAARGEPGLQRPRQVLWF